MKKVVLLFSPGLDSYLANNILSNRKDIELHRIYFDCCKYSINEICFMEERYQTEVGPTGFVNNNPEVRIYKDYEFRGIEQEDSHIPNRNLMFVTAASSLNPDADEIYINSMKDDRALDSGRNMFENYSPILSESVGHKVEVKSLFWNKEKATAVYEYLTNENVGLDLLMHTYSCFDRGFYREQLPIYNCLDTVSGNMYIYQGSFFVCGCMSCPACFRRVCALTAANIYVPFKNKELAENYRYTVDQKAYPERYLTIKNYLEFLDNVN